jgi:hypothetical protein
MIKKRILSIFLAITLCFSFAIASHSATVVSILAEGPLENAVAALEFVIQSDNADSADWMGSWPAGWLQQLPPGGKKVQGFDLSGSSTLPSGEIGRFEADNVILGDWALGDQDANTLPQDEPEGYMVKVVDGGYLITPVPIPPAILLLGGGLISLIAVRRRRS